MGAFEDFIRQRKRGGGGSGSSSSADSSGGSSGGSSSSAPNIKDMTFDEYIRYKKTGKAPEPKPTQPALEDFGNANPLSATVQSLTNQRDTIANQKYSDPMSQFMQRRGVAELDTAILNQSQRERAEKLPRNPITGTLLKPIGTNTIPMAEITPLANAEPEKRQRPAESRVSDLLISGIRDKQQTEAGRAAREAVEPQTVIDTRKKLSDLNRQISDMEVGNVMTSMSGLDTAESDAQRKQLETQRDYLNAELKRYESMLRPEYDKITEQISDLSKRFADKNTPQADKFELFDQITALNAQQKQLMDALGIEVKPIVEWDGRQDLIKEYKQLSRADHPNPVQRARLDEVRSQLEEGDALAGNGLQSYGFWDRASNTVQGAVHNVGSSLINAGATLFDAYSRGQSQQYGLGTAVSDQLAGIDPMSRIEMQAADYNSEESQALRQAMYETADGISEKAREDLEAAKSQLGSVGKAGVDIAENILEMGFDLGVSQITGGGSLASMGLRVFGGATQEARQAGLTLDQQLAYGLTKAGIELATEKMFDGVANVYGAGAADEVVEKVIGDLAKTDTGRTYLRMLSGGFGEGMEEVASDVLSNMMGKLTTDETLKELYTQDPSDTLYGGLIGFVIGFIGSGADIATGGNARSNAELRMWEAGLGAEAQADHAWDVLTGKTDAETMNQREREARERLGLDANGNPITQLPSARSTTSRSPTTVPQTETPAQPTVAESPTVQQATENAGNANANPAAYALLDILQNRRNPDSGLVTNRGVQAILDNPDFVELFNEHSPEKIEGTITQQKTIVKKNADLVADILSQISPSQGEVQYTEAEQKERLHLKDQVRANINELQKLPLVKSINSEISFDENSIQKAVDWICNKIGIPKKGNYSVERDGFGKVEFTWKRINNGFNYLPGKKGDWFRNPVGQALTTSCTAVPDVIKYGKEIEHHTDHKGRLYPTWTFAAPIEVDGETGVLAVVVKKTNKYYYEVHSILSPNGDLLMLDKNNIAEVSDGGDLLETLAPPKLSADKTIPQSAEESNNNVDDDDHTPPSGPSSPGGNLAVDGDAIETRERGESRNIRTDEARDQQLRDFKEKNPDIYEVVKNEKLLRKALDIFESQGVEGAAQTLEQALYDAQNGRKLPLEMVPLHKLVCDELSRQGQVERANRISSDIGAELTYFGQGSQANAILRNMSPTAKADAFAKFVNRIVAENNATVSQEAVDDLISRYRAAETDTERDAIIDDATTAIAQSSPTTLREAFTALRYLNMLGNFKTQGRNILGNTAMMIAAEAKDRVRAINQYAWNAVMRNHQVEQTSTLATSPKLFGEAWQMFNEDKAEAFGEGKYSDVAQGNKAVRDKKTIFKWNWKGEAETRGEQIGRAVFDAPMKVLEAYRKATSWAMNEGDVIFQKVTYARALADYAKAQGYDSLADIPADKLQTMREYAIQQAQEATFHDDNAVSDWFSNFDKGFGKGKVLTQGVVPFRKTPANVGVRMEEYSPIGLVNTAFEFYKAIHETGDFNAALNSAAKSLTGTGLAALGFMLARIGKARGKEDDEKLAAYEKNVQGLGDYSLVLDDGTTISMDWLQPEAGAFFMGVEAAELCEDGWQADDFMALLGTTTDIALNMSFMSGVNDFIEEIANNKDNQKATPSLLLNAFLKYASQGVTNSLAGEAEQFSEQYRQTYYTDPDSPLPTALQKQLAKLSGKTPGWDYNQADYIDAWGRKQDNGSVGMRAFESFLSPAYINEDRSTEVDEELKRLHEATKDTVKGSVLPTIADRSTMVGGQRLTPEEYELFQTRKGQTALKLVSDFINGEGYDSMSDEDRAKVITDLYGFARDTAKNSVLLSRGEQTEKSDYDKARAIKDAGGMSWAQYYQTKEGRDMDGSGKPGAEETAQYLFENFPEDKAKKIFDAYYPDSKTPYEEYAGHAQEIKDAGFTKQEYDALTATVKEAKTGAESWDSKGDNAVIDAVVAAVGKGLSEDGATLLITENTSKYYANPYSALIDSGRSMQESMDILNLIDAPGKKDGKEVPPDKAIQQAELKAYYKEHPEEEVVIALIWDSMGYTGKNTKDFETYKKTLK